MSLLVANTQPSTSSSPMPNSPATKAHSLAVTSQRVALQHINTNTTYTGQALNGTELELENGTIVTITENKIGKGSFKDIYAGTAMKVDKSVRPVAIAAPFTPSTPFSTFTCSLSATNPTHFIGPQIVRVPTTSGTYKYITISELCTPKGTYYAGKKVNDALNFQHPVSKNKPFVNHPDKNYLRLPFGMLQGTLEYYSALKKAEKYTGAHGDIKAKNFVFSNKRKHRTPYCVVKLIDLPEDPERASLPWTKFYQCKGLNKHANDLYALRTMLINALNHAYETPMFEGDSESVLKSLDTDNPKQIDSVLNNIAVIIQEKSKLTEIEAKEKAILEQVTLLKKALQPLQQISPQHANVLLTLTNCIGKLSYGIETTHNTAFGKHSQVAAMQCMKTVSNFLQTKLGPSGPTGSPMKPLPVPATASSSKRKLSPKKTSYNTPRKVK
ncbi:hypothetical protein COB21_02235 [Candidatus Aerophobetes bacterium]|uniref:Protein kinase domain-containing protein n=1 Tax=Aerophobetes bacterium TaxID=2030807 RepID=A0A2A4X773_UNCAE|nr:MAG: hypothetical protein COB21_02235 [Candidatus Aerophobetes bacterium]